MSNAVKELCSKTKQKRLMYITKYRSRFHPSRYRAILIYKENKPHIRTLCSIGSRGLIQFLGLNPCLSHPFSTKPHITSLCSFGIRGLVQFLGVSLRLSDPFHHLRPYFPNTFSDQTTPLGTEGLVFADN